MTDILAAADGTGLTAQIMTIWSSRIPDGFSTSVEAMAREGGGEWERLASGLSAISAMAKGGEIVRKCLGLPLEVLVERCREAKLEKARADADARVFLLREAAGGWLRNEAFAWLSRLDAEGLTPTDYARASQGDLDAVMRQLSEEGRRRAERLAQQEQKAEAERMHQSTQHRLRQTAIELLGPGRAEDFLRVPDPRIGAPPAHYCVDEASYMECVRLIKDWKPRGRKSQGRRSS